MRTDDLIDRLASDPRHFSIAPDRLLFATMVAAVVVVAVGFFVFVGPRPDFSAALLTWRFDYKFLFTLAVATSALGVLRPSLYPEARPNLWWLLAGPLLVSMSVALELATVPGAGWAMAASGKNALNCLTIVPALGIVPLALLILAIRQGAVTRPGWAGFTAGLVAGGLAATFYAANCTDDSPLFVATWYPVSILALGLVGAVAARLTPRW